MKSHSGSWNHGVVSEWPSMDAARAFWNSDAYIELKKLREGAADVSVYLCEVTAD